MFVIHFSFVITFKNSTGGSLDRTCLLAERQNIECYDIRKGYFNIQKNQSWGTGEVSRSKWESWEPDRLSGFSCLSGPIRLAGRLGRLELGWGKISGWPGPPPLGAGRGEFWPDCLSWQQLLPFLAGIRGCRAVPLPSTSRRRRGPWS